MEDKKSDQVNTLITIFKRFYYQRSPLHLIKFLQGEMKVLTFIYHCDGSILPGEIASALNMTGGRIAGALRSLEKKKYIVRKTDERDRRKVLVNITDDGIKCVNSGTSELIGMVSEITRILGESKTDALISSLEDLADAANKLENR